MHPHSITIRVEKSRNLYPGLCMLTIGIGKKRENLDAQSIVCRQHSRNRTRNINVHAPGIAATGLRKRIGVQRIDMHNRLGQGQAGLRALGNLHHPSLTRGFIRQRVLQAE